MRDYIKRDATILTDQNTSSSERQLFRLQLGTSIRTFYRTLKGYDNTSTSRLKEIWERELNVEIAGGDWEEAWTSIKSLSVCNRVKAIQLCVRTFVAAQLYISKQPYLDNLPQKSEHQVRFSLPQVLSSNIDNLAADG